ncbi:hypothetical protein [Streptomyces paludis]|uniref:hypothetical protein n=1 Tax=Streptomyces paludis TaxID=2282738 RepID=UPI0013B440E0|nr:hypothetical protein [Streptomyces paludis]
MPRPAPVVRQRPQALRPAVMFVHKCGWERAEQRRRERLRDAWVAAHGVGVAR